MKAVFPNPDKLLRSGGAGKIVIGRTVDNIVELPITSVKDIQDKFFVFKLADSSKVAMVPIQIDGKNKDTYYVKSGVKQGQNRTEQNRYAAGRDEGTTKESTRKIIPQRIITY